jgi:chromosome segregation ATPase
MALSIIPDALDSASKAFTDMKADLDEEKAARVVAQVEVDVLSRVVKDLKISTDRFATQIPILENKVKHLENKVVDRLNEVQAQEHYLERTTQAKDDYQKQISQLTKKLDSKSFGRFSVTPISFNLLLTDPALTHRIRCRA